MARNRTGIEFIRHETESTVLLDGKKAGVIKKVDGGWQYFAQGKKKYAGEIMPTREAVMRSVIGEDDE